MEKPYVYDEYLSMPDALSFEEAGRIYNMLLDNANTEDEDFADLWADLMRAAVRYANIRANWRLISRQERMDTDDDRTFCHDSVIIRLNAVTRCMKMNGWDISWRDELGSDERPRCITPSSQGSNPCSPFWFLIGSLTAWYYEK